MTSSERKTELVRRALAPLNADERAVVDMIYGLDGGPMRDYRTAALGLGWSKSKVHRLHTSAMWRMRQALAGEEYNG